jgi:hypothetical protein
MDGVIVEEIFSRSIKPNYSLISDQQSDLQSLQAAQESGFQLVCPSTSQGAGQLIPEY